MSLRPCRDRSVGQHGTVPFWPYHRAGVAARTVGGAPSPSVGKVSISIRTVRLVSATPAARAKLSGSVRRGIRLGPWGVLRLVGKAGFGLVSGWSVAAGGSFSIRALVRCPGQEPVRCHPWGCFACRRQRKAAAEHGRAEWGSDETRHGRPKAGQGQDRLGQSVRGAQVKPEPDGWGRRNHFSSHPRRRVSMFRRVGCFGI